DPVPGSAEIIQLRVVHRIVFVVVGQIIDSLRMKRAAAATTPEAELAVAVAPDVGAYRIDFGRRRDLATYHARQRLLQRKGNRDVCWRHGGLHAAKSNLR